MGGDAAHGAGNITEVGLVIFVQRRGHADDDDVHLGDPAVIGGGGEAVLPGGLNLRRRECERCRNRPRFSVSTLPGSMSKPVIAKALLAEQQGQRQAHISHADNADAGFASFDFMLDFCDLVQRRIVTAHSQR